ncbi:methyl-accepting chemotaxis protein [Thaumasiovibrio sp. DFM-14]|uniref:methyl-accepting chemotaxis protein n=1 Tax=Thaumasiovibrio sp. DFM-14 TaxID=3384792 RepID=UPI0039A3F48F
MRILQRIKIRQKLWLLIFTAITLLVINTAFLLYRTLDGDYAERKIGMQQQVETAATLINGYIKQNPRDLEAAGTQAISALRNIRYDSNNYFWITDTNDTLIMHPLREAQEGTSVANIKDANGKYHWQEMSRIGRTQGKGFLDYGWVSPSGDIANKISYVHLIPELNWVVGTGVHTLDIDSAFWRNMGGQVLVTLIIASLLVVIAHLIGRDITAPLHSLSQKVKALAHGDLTQHYELDRGDEVGDIAIALQDANSRIKSTLSAAAQTSEQSLSMAQSMAAASEQSAQSLNEQHEQLTQLATAMQQMSASIAEVAQHAELAANSTQNVATQTEQSNQLMGKTMQAISTVASDIEQSDQKVEHLKHGVLNISEVTTVIQGVSEQTNLLALNAAIEAARAGEQGRGFAVVADEVRNLAGRTQASTNEIQGTIDNLTQHAIDTAETMQASRQTTENTVNHANNVQTLLSDISTELNQTNEMIVQIATASVEQGSVAEEISTNINFVHQAADQINEAAQNLSQQSQALADSALQLGQQLNKFKY